MSFTLRIKNPPSRAEQWWAEYDTGIYSGWLAINETWDCPYGAYGATDLRIWVVDSDLHTLLLEDAGSPIYDDKSYVYDCSTGTLSEDGEAGGWKVLKTIDITLIQGEAGGWKVLKTIDITLTPPPPPPPPACEIDADCPTGYKCVNGKCVKVTPPGKEIPWELITAGGLAAGAAVLLIPKKKPTVKLPPKKKKPKAKS